jgi:hypothetical protein
MNTWKPSAKELRYALGIPYADTKEAYKNLYKEGRENPRTIRLGDAPHGLWFARHHSDFIVGNRLRMINRITPPDSPTVISCDLYVAGERAQFPYLYESNLLVEYIPAEQTDEVIQALYEKGAFQTEPPLDFLVEMYQKLNAKYPRFFEQFEVRLALGTQRNVRAVTYEWGTTTIEFEITKKDWGWVEEQICKTIACQFKQGLSEAYHDTPLEISFGHPKNLVLHYFSGFRAYLKTEADLDGWLKWELPHKPHAHELF